MVGLAVCADAPAEAIAKTDRLNAHANPGNCEKKPAIVMMLSSKPLPPPLDRGRPRNDLPLPRPDPLLQRLVEGVAGAERLFERGDADPLGAFFQKPAGQLGDLAAGAVERAEAVRIDVLAAGGDGAEALIGRLDGEMGRAR